MAEHPYDPHEVLVAPARAYPQVWRLIIGLVLAAAVAIFLSRTLHNVLLAIVPGLSGPQELLEGSTASSLLMLLFSFGFVTVGVMGAALVIQKRNPLGLIGPFPLAARQFWRVARILFFMSVIVMLLPPYDMGVELQKNVEPRIWIMLLPLSLFAVLVQTGTEEILFRGYIQQTLAARYKSPLVWMGVPSVVFAIGHYVPAEAGENAALIALWSGVFGLVTADLTARAGTLGPAIAVHLFNNVTALLIVSLPDTLSGLSLFTVPFDMSDTGPLRQWLAVDFAMMMVSWLAARVAIRR